MLKGVEQVVQLMILDKKDTWKKQADKLIEETEELRQAITLKDKENIAEEAWDVIQVAIGILDTLKETENVDIRLGLQKHLKKLTNRGWKDKGLVLFQIIKL